MIVVVDTNVVVSAAFWPRTPDHRCFLLLARRKYRLAATETILAEYRTTLTRVGQKECPTANAEPFFEWIKRQALVVDPAPLGKRRSRDPNDDPFLACAIGSGAKFIVTKDGDLLAMGKPFGVETIKPADFLHRL